MRAHCYDYPFILIVLFILSCCSNGNENESLQAPVPLADPFILLYEDTYYAYGTFSDEGIAVFTSDDLITWKRSPQLALHKENSWGERWFWAPEVYYIEAKNTFHMYYSADEHICVAVSASPLGPFVQEKKEPMIQGEKSIDNTLFIDEDGTPYLYFDRFNDGLNVWVAELDNDFQTIDSSTLVKCIHVSQPWEEVWPRVNEGAFVIKYKDLYYMTYSANSYESPFYGIGYATATSPKGPWKKYDKNPILQKPDSLVGVGHSSLFRDKDNRLRIAFHAHHSVREIHPRLMYISDVYFSDEDIPVMTVGKEILRPVQADHTNSK
ncbi:MAG: glycoside hydrolase family 43 protein [Tannerella sp.]|jgi:beta-xylosidase|nr:glycoside hydrolase family 43 protein [Tannerella sp.]